MGSVQSGKMRLKLATLCLALLAYNVEAKSVVKEDIFPTSDGEVAVGDKVCIMGFCFMKAPEKVGDGGVAVGDKLCIMGICIMKAPEKVGDEGVAVGDKLCLPPKCHSHGYKK